MLAQTVFFYSFLLILLLPIILSGIILLKKASSLDRFELLFPVGSILGITIFIFLLNQISYFVKGVNSVGLTYLVLIFFSLIFFKKNDFLEIDFPKGKSIFLFIAGLLFWAIFIFWKGSTALIGSDTNLYYAVAHTFINGNFPPMTPWQPDLDLAYHLGVFELLGAFFSITGLSFTFLHIFFSSMFIIISAQIIIWIWKRHDSFFSFFWGNLAASIVFISFGFFKIIIPIFPFDLPLVSNLHNFFLWLRGLPTVNEAIEVYGAPINLDALIYFIFHALGLAIFFSLLVLVIHPGKRVITEWITLMICGIALSLINESIFIVVFPSLILFKLFIDIRQKRLPSLKKMALITIISSIIIFYQNGFISSNLFSDAKIDPSVIFFPKREQIKDDFKAYHYYQQISKTHQINKEWLPFNWSHLGLDALLIISVILIAVVKITYPQKILSLVLFTSSVSSILAYNFIVPKFLVANGNRFLTFAYIFLGLLITYLLYSLIDSTRKKRRVFLSLTLLFISAWVFLPTIVPPFAKLTINRFGENKLIPKKEQIDESIKWAKDHLPYNQNSILLDIRAPHPSGIARLLVQAGIFSPIFPGDFRAYTIEASPEYFDIAYFLSPAALKRLDVKNLIIDSSFYSTLPLLKQAELADNRFFEILFSKEFPDGRWEKIYKILPGYFETEEMKGTIQQLTKDHSLSGKIYIDIEENFQPSYLRRALIFSLRNYNLYYIPQSGVYLNVESNINWTDPRGFKDYNFLVLGKTTNPYEICECKTQLIWKGLKDEVYLWKKID